MAHAIGGIGLTQPLFPGDSRFGWRARGAGLEHKRRAIVPVGRLKKEPKFDGVLRGKLWQPYNKSTD
jgi:hypothetical protein